MKCATGSGLVFHVGRGGAVAPGDWDNIIQNVIFRGIEGKSFYNIHKSCTFGCPWSKQIRKFTRAKHWDDRQKIQ